MTHLPFLLHFLSYAYVRREDRLSLLACQRAFLLGALFTVTAEVLHLCGGKADPLRDFVRSESMRRAASRNAHMRMRSHRGLYAHMQEKATDISRRKDRWGGNGSKSRRLWYVRMKDAEKARDEKGIHF